jgi:DNA-directed RNA polymerase specialized sigma24 family protein
MKIPERYLDEHFDRLIVIAASLLRRAGLGNLVAGDINDELMHNAEDLVTTTLLRLLKAETPSPTSDAGWTAFLSRALSMDARSVRRNLVKKKNRTVRIDARPLSARSDDRIALVKPFDSRPPMDFAGNDLHAQLEIPIWILQNILSKWFATERSLLMEKLPTDGGGVCSQTWLANLSRSYMRHVEQE